MRRAGQAREAGHLKRLWCTNCERVTNHVEVRPYGRDYKHLDFLFEYTYGNFIDGNRVEPDYKKFIRETLDKVIKGELPATEVSDMMRDREGR